MKILNIKENKDGSALFDIELSKQDEDKFKEIARLKKRKYDNEFIKRTILKALKNYVNKENKSE